MPHGLQIIDPVKEIGAAIPRSLASSSYQHDGLPDFLLGVVNPTLMSNFLTMPILQPPSAGGTTRPPNLSLELETLVRALQDAEILAVGNIPTSCVRYRYRVW